MENRQLKPTRPLLLHKPNGSGSGTAAKFNVRVIEEYGESEGEAGAKAYWKKSRGGLFVDLAKQLGANAAGHATFGWQKEQQLVTAKLGLPDLSALLVGYHEVRVRGRAVPRDLNPKPAEGDTPEQAQRKALTVSLFHRANGKGGGSTTAITYEFNAGGGTLRVSKSRELARNLNVSLAEEYRLFKFLESGLEQLLRLGVK